MTKIRDREIFERRRAGFSVGTLADAFGLSTGRVRVILAREEILERRRLELAEADSRPDQPNPLHLEAKLREKIATILQKRDFTPKDIENYKYGFSLAPFMATCDFSRRDWKALVECGVDPLSWTPLKSISGVSNAPFSKRLSAGVPATTGRVGPIRTNA